MPPECRGVPRQSPCPTVHLMDRRAVRQVDRGHSTTGVTSPSLRPVNRQHSPEPGSERDARDVVRAYVELSNAGEYEAAAALFDRSGTLVDHALNRVFTGRERIAESLREWATDWPTQQEITAVRVEAGKYTYRWRMTGRAASVLPLLGIGGDGRAWQLTGSSAGTVHGGLIVSHHSYWSLDELVAQFAPLPPHPTESSPGWS